MQGQIKINFNKRLLLLILFFIIITFVYSFSSNSLLKDKNLILNLNVNKNKQFTIDMLIGTSMKEMTVVISTLINQNIFLSDSCSNCSNNRKFNKETSQSFIQYNQKSILELNRNNHTEIYEGNECSETFYLAKEAELMKENNPLAEKRNFLKVDKALFVLLDVMNSSATENLKVNYLDERIKINAPFEFEWSDGILGLNINYSEITRNFISQMWLQNLINSPKLFIFYPKRIENSKLFLGDFSQSSNSVLSTYLNKINFCDASPANDEWGCNLTYLRIKHRKIFSNSKVRIDTLTQYTSIPEALFENIIDYIIEEAKLQSREDCKLNEFKKLICRCDNPNLFPDITLNIESKDFNLVLKDLYDFFPNDEFQCHFKILISKNNVKERDNESKNNIVLGTESMKNSIFTFNFEERKLGLAQFSDSEVDKILNSIENQSKNNTTSALIDGHVYMKIISLIALIVIVILLIGLYNCSNSFRFSNSYLDQDQGDFQKRKSLDYCQLTDENYVYSNEKFKSRTQSRKNINSDFDSFDKVNKETVIAKKDKKKSYDFKDKAFNIIDTNKRLSRKESFASERKNSKINLEMKNLL